MAVIIVSRVLEVAPRLNDPWAATPKRGVATAKAPLCRGWIRPRRPNSDTLGSRSCGAGQTGRPTNLGRVIKCPRRAS